MSAIVVKHIVDLTACLHFCCCRKGNR